MKKLILVTALVLTISACTEDKKTVTEGVNLGGMTSNGEQVIVKQKLTYPKFISAEMRTVLKAWIPYWELPGFTGMPAADDHDAWRASAASKAVQQKAASDKVAKKFQVTVEEKHLGGVRVLEVTPKNWVHKDKVLVHFHGGGMYSQSPDTMMTAYVPLADEMNTKIVSVDYRLLPSWDYGILEQIGDGVTVFKHLVEKQGYKASNIGMFGCSAGGIMTMGVTNRLSHEGYPLPGAIVPQSGMYDWTLDSDTYKTLDGQDPVASTVQYFAPIIAMARLTEDDLIDPSYSPVFDTFTGRKFPPALFQAGGREVLLSDSFRMYDKLKQAGHEAELDIHDAMPHCAHNVYYAPEAKVIRQRTADWFKEHMDFSQ